MCCDTQVMAANGLELVRTWAFLNGKEDPYTNNGTLSIQPEVCCTAACLFESTSIPNSAAVGMPCMQSAPLKTGIFL